MYKCFVICPFGNKNGTAEEKRLYAERIGLQSYIFSPAMALCKDRGWDVVIEDGEARISSGAISIETARGIDEADVVILVATSDMKPNVWIELGWAHGVWQNPIYLVRDGYTLPLDVTENIGEIFSPDITNGKDPEGASSLANRLAHRIISRLEGPSRTIPFPHLKDTTLAVGKFRFYGRFSKAFTFQQWLQVMLDADKEIIIASPRMLEVLNRGHKWTDSRGTPREDLLSQILALRALDNKIKVTVILQHPENYTDAQMRRDKKRIESLEEVRYQLIKSYKHWANYVRFYRQSRQSREIEEGVTYPFPTEESFRVIQLRHRYLPYRVTLTEKKALTTLRFYSESVNSGLCIESQPADHEYEDVSKPFYEQIREELNFLISENEEHCEPDFQEYLKTVPPGLAG